MKKLLFALAAFALSGAALAAVNLNTASKEELVALPGIGPVKAQAILDYRAKNGPFKAVDDVRKVKGIGEKLYAQIKPELVVAGGSPKPVAAATPAREGGRETKAVARTDAGKIAGAK